MGRFREKTGEIMLDAITLFIKASTCIGVPVLLWIIAFIAKQGFLLGACNLTGQYCDGTGERVEVAMHELMDSYPDYDVTMKPKKQR